MKRRKERRRERRNIGIEHEEQEHTVLLFRVGVAIMKELEPQLLQMSDFGSLFAVLTNGIDLHKKKESQDGGGGGGSGEKGSSCNTCHIIYNNITTTTCLT